MGGWGSYSSIGLLPTSVAFLISFSSFRKTTPPFACVIGRMLEIGKGHFVTPTRKSRRSRFPSHPSFSTVFVCSLDPCVSIFCCYNVLPVTGYFFKEMNIAQMLDHPGKDTSTRTETQQPRDIITSTSGSPISTPHTRSDAAKTSTTKRRQIKAACLACRQRKSKVGIPPPLHSSIHLCPLYPSHCHSHLYPLILIPTRSATARVHPVKSASTKKQPATIQSSKE